MSLYDVSKRDASEDVFRLTGVELVVTSDEQLAKARSKVAEINGSVQLKVTWQPMTYNKFIGDEKVTEEVDYIKMTKANAVSDAALPLLREAGMKAVQKPMLIALPTNPAKADPDKQAQAYPRFMVAATKAGITLDVTDDGQVTSPQIGQLFVCRTGYEEFPTPGEDAKGNFKWDWEDTRSTFMRVPVKPAKDFVEPAEADKREFRYERRDDEDGGGAATTTTSATAVSGDEVAAAVRALGISGKAVKLIDDNGLAIVTGKVAEYRALAVLVAAASAGGLSAELVNRGLATIDGDVLVVN